MYIIFLILIRKYVHESYLYLIALCLFFYFGLYVYFFLLWNGLMSLTLTRCIANVDLAFLILLPPSCKCQVFDTTPSLLVFICSFMCDYAFVCMYSHVWAGTCDSLWGRQKSTLGTFLVYSLPCPLRWEISALVPLFLFLKIYSRAF